LGRIVCTGRGWGQNSESSKLHKERNTVKLTYNGPMGGGVIGEVRYNRVKRYSQKYTIGYIGITHNKHRNT
jgi:hypothetical protein